MTRKEAFDIVSGELTAWLETEHQESTVTLAEVDQLETALDDACETCCDKIEGE